MSDPQAPDLNLSMRVDPDPQSPEGSPDLSAWRTVYLIGIGGAGMRGIATLLLARGIQVAGSDLKDSSGLQALGAAGATVFVGHRADQVTHADAVVVSSAVPSTNVEVERARELGLAVLSRAREGELAAGTGAQEERVWEPFCQVLLCANEFIYVD